MTEDNQQSALLGKIVAYTELLVNDPRSTIFVSLAETYRKMGLFNDAREIVVKGLELHRDFGPAYVVLARIECQLDHIDASCVAFARALELDPDNLAALVGYARVKLLLQQENAARDLLIHARSLNPADPVINKMLLGLSPQPAAAEEPAPAVESVPPPANNLTALASTTLADLYLAQGLTDKALSLYRQLLSRNPDNLELRRKIREMEGRSDEPSSSDKEEVDALASLTSSEPIDVKEQQTPASLVDEATQQNESVSVPVETVAEMDHDIAESTMASSVSGEGESEAAEEKLLYETTDPSNDQTDIINKLNNWLDNIRLRREHV